MRERAVSGNENSAAGGPPDFASPSVIKVSHASRLLPSTQLCLRAAAPAPLALSAARPRFFERENRRHSHLSLRHHAGPPAGRSWRAHRRPRPPRPRPLRPRRVRRRVRGVHLRPWVLRRPCSHVRPQGAPARQSIAAALSSGRLALSLPEGTLRQAQGILRRFAPPRPCPHQASTDSGSLLAEFWALRRLAARAPEDARALYARVRSTSLGARARSSALETLSGHTPHLLVVKVTPEWEVR